MEKKNYYIDQLNDIGYLLSEEKDFQVVMRKILTTAKKLSNADAGTFYLMNNDNSSLVFTAVQTDSLGLDISKAEGTLPWPNLPLHKKNGEENDINISVYCALNNTLINVEDVYHYEGFDFQGPKAFDEANGYRTKSMLVVPMKSYDNTVIGVLQLINKKDENGESIPFNKADEKLILSMGSQAAVSITQSKLVQDLENLLDSFVQAIATAIGAKSKYTQGHINRVADLTEIIAIAVNENKDKYKEIEFDEEDMQQLDLAAWMHDVGKITTPDHIIDKATKLEKIRDGIETVKVRFELLKKELEVKMLQEIIKTPSNKEDIELEYYKQIEQLNDDKEFLVNINFGGEFMSDEYIQRIYSIAKYQVTLDGIEQNILNEDEIYNLCIKKGTITPEERNIVNNHAKLSYEILSSLPFPKKYERVPEIAGGHHEKINGKGYPLGLKGDEISFEARIVAIADIFESLTASDRPYKKPNTINQAIKILYFMAKDDELDKELVKFFVEKELYMIYAKDNIAPSQIDKVDTKLFKNL